MGHADVITFPNQVESIIYMLNQPNSGWIDPIHDNHLMSLASLLSSG
jgi:hypothetical protein